MLSLKDFKATKIDSTNLVTGGADQNETPGGSHIYYGSYYPGGKATRTWSSDYWVEEGVLEHCDVVTTYG